MKSKRPIYLQLGMHIICGYYMFKKSDFFNNFNCKLQIYASFFGQNKFSYVLTDSQIRQ